MKELKIDFDKVHTANDLHDELNKSFGFLDGYGRNINALIDCWSSLRYPEDEMVAISLKEGERLILSLVNVSDDKMELIDYVMSAVKNVNYRYSIKGYESVILINMIGKY